MPTDEEQESRAGELTLDDNIEQAPDTQESLEVDDDTQDTEDTPDKRVKDAQRKLHEETQKRAALEKALDEMKGKITVLTDIVGKKGEEATIQEENPFAFLDTPEFKESLLDSGDNVVGALKKIVAEFGKTLHMRDRMLMSEFNSRDPEIRSVREQIAAFREKYPDMNDFSDQHVVKVLKNMIPQEQAPVKKTLSIGSRNQRPVAEDDEFKKEEKFWYDRIDYSYYDKPRAKAGGRK